MSNAALTKLSGKAPEGAILETASYVGDEMVLVAREHLHAV